MLLVPWTSRLYPSVHSQCYRVLFLAVAILLILSKKTYSNFESTIPSHSIIEASLVLKHATCNYLRQFLTLYVLLKF